MRHFLQKKPYRGKIFLRCFCRCKITWLKGSKGTKKLTRNGQMHGHQNEDCLKGLRLLLKMKTRLLHMLLWMTELSGSKSWNLKKLIQE